MTDLAVISWLWRQPGSLYGPRHINILRAMVKRHLSVPHTFWCIGDSPDGLHPEIRFAPIPPPLLPTVTPQVYKQAGLLRMRRVQLFDPAWARTFGARLFQLDIDVVITGSLDPLVERAEPVVVLANSCQAQPSITGPGNPSLLIFDADALGECWERYRANPETMYAAARKDGRTKADGAVLGYYLNRVRARGTWGSWELPKYGVFSYMRDIRQTKLKGALPKDARVTLFYGNDDPSSPETVKRSPWIREHWRDDR